MGMGAWEQVDKSMWTGVCGRERVVGIVWIRACRRECNFFHFSTSFFSKGMGTHGSMGMRRWKWECGDGTFLAWGWERDFFQLFSWGREHGSMGMGVWALELFSMGKST